MSQKSVEQLHLLAALLDQFRHQPRPSGLMIRAESSAVVAVKIFVKQNQILPVRIISEDVCPAIPRPPPIFTTQEKLNQPPRYFPRHMPQIRFNARTSRELHLEVLSV